MSCWRLYCAVGVPDDANAVACSSTVSGSGNPAVAGFSSAAYVCDVPLVSDAVSNKLVVQLLDHRVGRVRVSFETSFDSKQPKLEPKLVLALSETKRLFRLFCFYTETESFDVSIEPKQTGDQPKQFDRDHILIFFTENVEFFRFFSIFSVFFSDFFGFFRFFRFFLFFRFFQNSLFRLFRFYTEIESFD
jgi:hypothetical protein